MKQLTLIPEKEKYHSCRVGVYFIHITICLIDLPAGTMCSWDQPFTPTMSHIMTLTLDMTQLTSGSFFWDPLTTSSCRFGAWSKYFVDSSLKMSVSQSSALKCLRERANFFCGFVFASICFLDYILQIMKHSRMTHIEDWAEFFAAFSSWFSFLSCILCSRHSFSLHLLFWTGGRISVSC